MGCLKLEVLNQHYSPLKVVHSKSKCEDTCVQGWLSVDPKAEAVMSLSTYQSAGNNPISNTDPDGDLFFAIPQISFSGGFSIGLEVGIGAPGILSASVTGGVNLSSGAGYWSIQGAAYGAYAGYGSNGAFAGFGYRYGGATVGVGYGSGGWSANAGYGGSLGGGFSGSLGLSYGSGGFGFNGSLAHTSIFGQNDLPGLSGSGKGGTQGGSILPDGRYIYDLSYEEQALFATPEGRRQLFGGDFDIQLNIAERIYLIGQWFTLALPSAKLAGGLQWLKSAGSAGSTGRTTAVNLTEQLAMKEIMSNPRAGKELIKSLSDSRWKGWSKMSNRNAHGVEIHYNAQFKNGSIINVDDFKFISP